MESYIDLHIHTVFSDGSLTPGEVVQFAKKSGFTAISITDHDNIGGIQSALNEGAVSGVEIVPGVELSVLYALNPAEMHILGYYIDWQNKEFQHELQLFRDARLKRAWIMMEKFHKLGIAINEEKIFSVSGKNGSIGRLHFAKYLLESGIVNNIKEAFNKYLDINKPAYVPKKILTAEQAIRMIAGTGGIPVLAHPYYGNFDNDNVLKELIGYGLKGIEALHTRHTKEVEKKFIEIGSRFGLIITGGSDFHGQVDPDSRTIGLQKIPYSVLTQIKQLAGK